jgi:AcrR family transcriptional regulator
VKRRTQEERIRETRGKLLKAATEVLLELGYAQFTTTEVCKRAGLSQGALFSHFPSKLELLGALATDLYRQVFDEFDDFFQKAEGASIEKSLHHLWDIFQSPKNQASYDITQAARSNPQLKDIIEPVIAEHRKIIREFTRNLYKDYIEKVDDFDAMIDLIIMVIQGGTINEIALPEPETRNKRLQLLNTLIEQSMALPSSRTHEKIF